MYLRDGGGGNRLLFNLLKELRGGELEFTLYNPLDLCKVEGGDIVLELEEFVDIIIGQEVRPGGEELTDLYKARTELLEGQPQPYRVGERIPRTHGFSPLQPLGDGDEPGQVEPLQEGIEAVAYENGNDLAKPL